jgi:hypothetical protein
MTRVYRFLVALLAVIIALPLLTNEPALAAPQACTEQVANGGFESSGPEWQTTSGGGYALISHILPRTGEWGAYLGGYNNAYDELAQIVTIPAGSASKLRFWWQMSTLESTHPWDSLEVKVAPAAGGAATRVFLITDGSVANDWQEAVVDLTSYAGQSLRLSFRAATDSDRATDFYLDDISLEACASVPPPNMPWHIYLPNALAR